MTRSRTQADGSRAPTSADVARLADVSQTTVSQVLNGKAGITRISAETREKVIAAAARLGYTPNHAARSLRQRRTKLIALVLPTLDNPYFSDVVNAAQEAARERGYAVTVMPIREGDGFRASSLLQGAACDGIIVAGHENCASPELRLLQARGLAVAVLQEQSPDPAISSISVDLEAGGHLATRHLVALGHRRIGHVTERLRPAANGMSRIDGYRRALAEAGLAFDPALVVVTENSMAGGATGAERLLATEGEPATAAFVYNDQLAVGALARLRERGLLVPRDFAVVGFDGLAVGGFTAPPLTSVDSPRGTLGRLAAEVLIRAIEAGSPMAETHRLPVRLLVRGSCGGQEPGDPPP
ncbi:LacI family DNA-binding transcriptional regulator [Aureimonas pseudogalii]|uniref:LacI family transcriptional regulator n=1 Tax=Aureimonas pseudogalii TaxID=1744844 RepID=A0A7W6ML65_9HYPH|nr:LacI family DNA-binding transcriptional regulator [Aureimonas pseudogalii]MBB3999494.1 LacI family transcriptional regulator [Aureimonas pseudogalii]